jgi:hypothetical protein
MAGRGGGQQRLIWSLLATDDDQLPDARYAVANLLEDREKRLVDEDDAVVGVGDDVRQIVRGEPQIQRMQHSTRARDREVEFQVLVRIPAERAHALAALDAYFQQRMSQPVRPGIIVAVTIAVGAALDARGDLFVRKKPPCALEEMLQGQRIVHHQPVHVRSGLRNWPSLCRSCNIMNAYSVATPCYKRIMMRVIAALVAASGLALGATDDPLKTLRAGHPRLIALDADIEHIRMLIQQYPLARRIHADLMREAEQLMTTPTVEYKLVGPSLLAQSRRCLERVYTLALLYRLHGRKPYLDRAIQELRAAADFKDWNPAHFLDTAEMTHAFAIGYDWLYPALSPEERDWIRAALVEKGLNPALTAYETQASWVANRFNWNQVCNGGIALGALAVADEEPEKSRTLLRNALDSIPHALASYAPDGGWAEGPGYWHYGTSYTVYLLAALESALGTDFGLSSARGFDRTGRFRIYFSGPSGRHSTMLTRDHTDPAPEMFWLARRFAEPAYAWRSSGFSKPGQS